MDGHSTRDQGLHERRVVQTGSTLVTCLCRDQCSSPAVRPCQLEPTHARDVRGHGTAIEREAGGRWPGSCLGQAELPAVEEREGDGEQVGENGVEGRVVEQLRHALREAWDEGRRDRRHGVDDRGRDVRVAGLLRR